MATTKDMSDERDPSADLDSYEDLVRAEGQLRADLLDKVEALGGPVPELYFATVRAIGTPLADTVIEPLRETLERYDYSLVPIRLSDRLIAVSDELDSREVAKLTPYERYKKLTKAGENQCRDAKRRDALVIEGVRHLHDELRAKARAQASKEGHRGVAYLFRNVMHPEEIEKLRKLYGGLLFVISAFSPESDRFRHLKLVLANGDPMRADDMGSNAAKLIQRETGRLAPEDEVDPKVVPGKFRMNVPSTWQHADLFLDISEPTTLAGEISRFVEVIFGNPYQTPQAEEIAMSEAFGAALESGNLSRRVGAAIISSSGDIVSIGTNDVPRPGGGVYRAGEEPDHRDHTFNWGYESSDRHRRSILRDLLERMLIDPEWVKLLDDSDLRHALGTDLAQSLKDKKVVTPAQLKRIAKRLINSDTVWRSQFFDVIEYSRTLHAEMDAITSAARKGISTTGSTLYCTTMPCHECARLIIGAGIKRVMFVEPYDKSRAMALYPTEIRLHTMHSTYQQPDDSFVHFIPYVGISPRRFHDLFSWVARKSDDRRSAKGRKRHLDGQIIEWNPKEATVRDSIISGSGMNSVSRFFDLYVHEHRTLSDYDEEVSRMTPRSSS